jgi:hypothetical protein
MTTITTETLPPVQLTFQEEEEDSSFSGLSLISGPFAIYAFWLGLLVVIWIISGVAAFIASFVCLFYSSSVGDKMAGLVMALFAGPFYWLFYIYNSNYCNRYSSYGY